MPVTRADQAKARELCALPPSEIVDAVAAALTDARAEGTDVWNAETAKRIEWLEYRVRAAEEDRDSARADQEPIIQALRRNVVALDAECEQLRAAIAAVLASPVVDWVPRDGAAREAWDALREAWEDGGA